MRFDAGEVTFYKKTNVAGKGLMPEAQYSRLFVACYAELTVGVFRFNQAKQNDARVDLLLRIPRAYGLSPGDAATLAPYSHATAGEIYSVYQVQQTEDEDGLPVTDVSLMRDDGIDASKIIDA